MLTYAIIVDFDRTLLRSDKRISEFSLRVLRARQEAGIRLFAATARPERAIGEYRQLLSFDGITTLNGARVLLGDKVHEAPMTPDSAARVLQQLCCLEDSLISVEAEDGLYANQDHPLWHPRVIEDIGSLPDNKKIYKILVSHPYCPLDELMIPLPRDIYTAVADRKLIQFMDKNATKWLGVQKMLAAYEIAPSEAVYFGDDNDDLEPIRHCGLGVAVENALDVVKEAADDVTASNDADGVARYLEAHIPWPGG